MNKHHFRTLLGDSTASRKQSQYAARVTPSRRASKSTSHGTMSIHLSSFRVVPGVGLETQVIGLASKRD